MMKDKRTQVIEYIGRCIERKRILSVDKCIAFINTQFYNDLIAENEYDILLSCYIRALGLDFALLCENIHTWRKDTLETNKEFNYKLWNRRLQTWNDKPNFPQKPIKDRVKSYVKELNETELVEEGTNKTSIPDKKILDMVKKAHGLPDTATLEYVYGDKNLWIAVAKYPKKRIMYVLTNDKGDTEIMKTGSLPKLKDYVKSKLIRKEK